MASTCNASQRAYIAIRTFLAMLLLRHAVADSTAPGVGFDCGSGCHRAFKPVCGTDGRTYSNACVATCQDVQVARVGSCPGEPLLHPSNEHVVTEPGEGPSSAAAATAAPSASAGAGPLTRHHLDAFRHEGFRYTGQMRFTDDMPQKHRHFRSQQQQQQQQDVGGGAASAAAAGLGLLDQQLQQQAAGSLRAVRVTRTGHVYMADVEENVDQVLDTLIQRQKEADAAAAEQEQTSDQQQQQQGAAHTHVHAHAHALLHSLQRWRGYRGSGGGGAGGMGGGSKWARHTVITATSGPTDHALQPVLDATGAATAAAAAGFAATTQDPATATADASSTAATSVTASSSANADSSQQQQEEQQQQEQANRQQQQQQGGSSGLSWTTRILGGGSLWGARREDKRPGGGGDGGKGSMSGQVEVEVHRPVRRSLGIFETDDRFDCPRTPSYPFTAIGQINIRDSSGNYVCSGTLVGPDVVLTAAHCVFNRAAQAFYERLDFAPSRYRTLNGAMVNPFGVVPWSYVTVYQGYSSLSTPDPNTQDIAVITLSQRIGSQAGWMGVFEPCSPYAPTRYVALTAGYPSDQAAGSCKTTQCVVVQEPCTDGYLYHKCDTASGQSGSPMYMMAMTAGRRMGPYIRGVHNIEWVQEMPGGALVSYINSAVSITPDHYRSILAWIGLSFTTNGTTPMGPALPPTDYMSQLSS